MNDPLVFETILIREIREADLQAIKLIEQECRLSPWSTEDYRQELNRMDSIHLVATSDNLPVGFIIARPIMSEIEIYNVGVSPLNRRTGVGQRLVNELIKRAESLKAEKVWLEVRESNSGAIKFYEKLGFTQVGHRKDFYANPLENALLLELMLNQH